MIKVSIPFITKKIPVTIASNSKIAIDNYNDEALNSLEET